MKQKIVIHEALTDIAEELRHLTRLLDEAEARMRSPLISPEDRFYLHANYFAWTASYRSTLMTLFDVCQQINRQSKELTNIRHISVYQMEKKALKELRALHLRTN